MASNREFNTVDDIQQYYHDNIARYGLEAPRTMGYHQSPIDDRLISNMLPQEMVEAYSVLDVGCGLGQLLPILSSKFPDSQLIRLVGIDLVNDFIDSCRQQYPEHSFYTANFMDWEPNEQFDLVLAAGVLVTRISNFEDYLEKFIGRMVLASKCWIGFNLVAEQGPNYTAKHLASISESRLWEILQNFSNLEWSVNRKEVFPGSQDLFVCGKVKESKND